MLLIIEEEAEDAPLIKDPPQWDTDGVLAMMHSSGKPAENATILNDYANLPEYQSKLRLHCKWSFIVIMHCMSRSYI